MALARKEGADSGTGPAEYMEQEHNVEQICSLDGLTIVLSPEYKKYSL
jgi:hypothetical protein